MYNQWSKIQIEAKLYVDDIEYIHKIELRSVRHWGPERTVSVYLC